MRTDEVFERNSETLKCSDLKGHHVTVEIESYKVKKFDDGSKPILYFVGKEKCLVVNRTNAFSIGQILGSTEMDHWIGQKITLKPDKTLFQGKMTDCIRIDERAQQPVRRPPARPVPTPAPEPEEPWEASDGDVPF